MKRFIILIAVICSLAEHSMGQEGKSTSYYLQNLPQRVRLNPAYQPEYKVYIGLPGLSGISLNYLNTSFHAEDLLRKGRQDSVYLDINKFYKSLRKQNFINISNENSLLTVGVRVKKNWYATLDITQKNDFLFRFNKDLFTFLKNGNADYLGKTFDFGRLGLKGSMYSEFALGLSRKINDKLTVGARAKFLLGIANVDMTDSEISVYTAEDGELMRLKSKQNIRVSAPVQLEYNKTGAYVDWDHFDIDTDNLGVSSVLNVKNPGFAIDLGAEYKLDDKWTFFASLTDLGFIRWGGDNNYRFTQDASFDWKGVDVSNSVNSSADGYISLDDAFDDLVDSLKNNFRFMDKQGAYTTMVRARLYAGASYEVSKLLNVGGLLQAALLDGRFYPSLTASANARFHRNVSASVTYSVMPGNYMNVGAGLTAKLGPVQLYLVTDNVLAANYTHTQSVSARLGINLLIGHKDWKRKEKEEVAEVTIVPIIPPLQKKDSVVKNDSTVQVVTKRENVTPEKGHQVMEYYVIVGSFLGKENAEELRKWLISRGYVESSILRNAEGMYRVSMMEFNDKETTRKNVLEIRETYPQFQDAWLLEATK